MSCFARALWPTRLIAQRSHLARKLATAERKLLGLPCSSSLVNFTLLSQIDTSEALHRTQPADRICFRLADDGLMLHFCWFRNVTIEVVAIVVAG